MKVILSCTTIFERSEQFYYCIQSLKNQSLQPDVFLLNISKTPYLKDSGFQQVPNWMNSGKIQINWVENTGPYRKLLPAVMMATEDDVIVTSDDDVLYGKNWLSEIVQNALENPSDIVCGRARKMKKNYWGRWQNYFTWKSIPEKEKSLFLLPIGCAGVAYRKRHLDLSFLFDNKYRDISPTSDDLWFKMSSMRKKTHVKVYPAIDQKNIYLKYNGGLDQVNVRKIENTKLFFRIFERFLFEMFGYLGINQSRNDQAWEAICNYSKKLASGNTTSQDYII